MTFRTMFSGSGNFGLSFFDNFIRTKVRFKKCAFARFYWVFCQHGKMTFCLLDFVIKVRNDLKIQNTEDYFERDKFLSIPFNKLTSTQIQKLITIGLVQNQT